MIGGAKVGVVLLGTALANRVMDTGPVDEDDAAIAVVAFGDPSQSAHVAPGGGGGGGQGAQGGAATGAAQ